jgi:hypothetical protein
MTPDRESILKDGVERQRCPNFKSKGIIKFGNQEVVLILQTRIANALRKCKSSIHASSWSWVEAIFFAQRSLALGVIQSLSLQQLSAPSRRNIRQVRAIRIILDPVLVSVTAPSLGSTHFGGKAPSVL